MKKNIVAIGIMCTLVVALGLGFYILREEDTPPALLGPAQIIHLFEYDRPPVSVWLEIPGWEYTLLRLDYDPDRGLVSNSTILEFEGLPLDTGRINAVLSASRSLSYLELVGDNLADLEAFGLAQPRGVVRLDFEEHGQRTILIGDVAPGNIGVYIQLDESSAVYLTPIHGLENFLRSPLDYFNLEITPFVWPPESESMTLGGQVRERAGEILVVYAGEGNYRLVEPFAHEIDPWIGEFVLASPFGVIMQGVAMIHPTLEDLEMLGLYPAYSTVTVEGGEAGGFTLRASPSDEDGMVFLYREGVPVVYVVDNHTLEWLDIQFYQLMNQFVPAPQFRELSGMEINFAGGQTYAFDFEWQDNGVTAYYNGQLVNRQHFEFFLGSLISALLEPIVSQPDELGEPLVTYRFIHSAGGESTISFYQSEVPLRHYIRADGGMVFLTHSSYTNHQLREDIHRLIDMTGN